MATGSVSGTIFILNTLDGNLVSQLPVSKVCIGCLAYSPEGDFLAAGCEDGVLYVLPVYENGFSYEKVSVLKVNFQNSLSNAQFLGYILIIGSFRNPKFAVVYRQSFYSDVSQWQYAINLLNLSFLALIPFLFFRR